MNGNGTGSPEDRGARSNPGPDDEAVDQDAQRPKPRQAPRQLSIRQYRQLVHALRRGEPIVPEHGDLIRNDGYRAPLTVAVGYATLAADLMIGLDDGWGHSSFHQWQLVMLTVACRHAAAGLMFWGTYRSSVMLTQLEQRDTTSPPRPTRRLVVLRPRPDPSRRQDPPL